MKKHGTEKKNSFTDTVDVSQHRINTACFIISKSAAFIRCYTKLSEIFF